MGESGKNWTIAYFNSILSEKWAEIPWRGAVEEAKVQKVNLLAFHGNVVNDEKGFNKQANIIYDLARCSRIDGLISWKGSLTTNLHENEIFDFLSGYNVPVITIEGSMDSFPSIIYGNYEGMKLNVDHLVSEHKFKNIAYLGLVPDHAGFGDRYKGYIDGLKEHGLKPNPDFIKPWVSWIPEIDGKPADYSLDNWLKNCIQKGVQAVIGACDPIAVWVIERLTACGYNVPENMAVCGFDGFSRFQNLKRPLTTIDPDWAGLGRIAVKRMVELLEKKDVAQVTTVQAKQKISKTCGCMDDNVIKISCKPVSLFAGIFKKPKFFSDAQEIVQDIIGEEGKAVSESLLKALFADINGNKNTFIIAFDRVLIEYSGTEKNFSLWQDFITNIQKYLECLFFSKRKVFKGHLLCDQARVLITNTLERFKNRQSSEKMGKKRQEQILGTELITTFSMDELCSILEKGLYMLNINSCYLMLYENPKQYTFPDFAPEWSNVLLVFKNLKRIDLPPDKKRIESKEIIPEEFFLESSPSNYCIHSLYSGDNQIGFIVYESETPDADTYDFITNQIARGIHGVQLLEKINNHSNLLGHGIEQLSGSIEQIVRNIENIFDTMNAQGAAVSEEASAIEEMRNNIKHIAEMSDKTASISSELDSAAVSGAASVKNLVNAIQGIQKKSDNIRTLSTMIQEISDKTKILAFNAAIEAVHAGKSGTGFNIVATEIRKLAEETENNIRGIGSELKILLDFIVQSGKLADKTIERLDSIIVNSRSTNNLNNQLNNAMKEQDRGIMEILTATERLVDITSEIETAISEQKSATNDFKETLLKLREIV